MVAILDDVVIHVLFDNKSQSNCKVIQCLRNLPVDGILLHMHIRVQTPITTLEFVPKLYNRCVESTITRWFGVSLLGQVTKWHQNISKSCSGW